MSDEVILDFCSVAKLYATLWDPMKCSTLGFPTLQYLPQYALSRWCYLTISSSAAPFSFALNLSQHQGLFQWVSSSHQVAKVSELRALIQWLVSLSRLNPMTGVLLRRHSEKGDACRGWDWSHAATGLQSRKRHAEFLPKACRVMTVLPTPWFQTSSL